jgi:predicted lipase
MNWEYVKPAITASKEVYENWLDVSVKSIEGTDKVLIACAGTEDIADWLTNFAFLFNRDMVHRGFLNNAFRIMALVLNKVNVNQSLILTGHSLGGATAVLLGVALKLWGFNVEQIITFGCPRVGNKQFSDYYQSLSIPTIHYVCGSDIVPSTPPWLLGFRTLPGLRVVLPSKKMFRIISDHRISSYLKHFYD